MRATNKAGDFRIGSDQLAWICARLHVRLTSDIRRADKLPKAKCPSINDQLWANQLEAEGRAVADYILTLLPWARPINR
ncbi:hypothetical protein M2318_005476 [Metapseudomonas resinovorans]|uniref:hypothetical protein n=1 Tax=Metapseudomonas resinovorans TaxID=53412 RepID=UPI003D1D1901